jgi:hypothetical protein
MKVSSKRRYLSAWLQTVVWDFEAFTGVSMKVAASQFVRRCNVIRIYGGFRRHQSLLSWLCRWHVLSKRGYGFTKTHDVMWQKTLFFLLKSHESGKCKNHLLIILCQFSSNMHDGFFISKFRRVLNVCVPSSGQFLGAWILYADGRFGTHCVFNLHRQVGMKNSSYISAYEGGTDRMFRNVCT